MKKLTPLIMLASLFIASTASSEIAEVNGSMLLDSCNEAIRYIQNKNAPGINFSSVNFCVGFVSGIDELHTSFVSSVSCFDPPLYCKPATADTEQLVGIVVKFLKAHPEDLSFLGSVVAISSLKEAFPCAESMPNK